MSRPQGRLERAAVVDEAEASVVLGIMFPTGGLFGEFSLWWKKLRTEGRLSSRRGLQKVLVRERQVKYVVV